MFLLLGCLTSQTEYDALLLRAQDADQDGMAAVEYGGTDCDDTDAQVNPLATEVCDGVDNDCNGLVDDAPRDPLTWFLDGDGDGFGDDGRTAQGCEAPAAHVGVGGDCDDGDSLIRPDGYEVCDGVDNDCDGLVDDADDSVDLSTGQAWYPDGDGDGYGDGFATAVSACTAPDGLLLDFTDCDDGDFDVNPNASEICKDGLDNDCSGDAPECALRGEYALENADLSFTGRSVQGATTDQDNDGVLELVIGLPETEKNGAPNVGSVILLAQPYKGSDATDAIWTFHGDREGDAVGAAVHGAKDLNADGLNDLLIAAPGVPAVYLFFGDTTGYPAEPDVEITGGTAGLLGLELQVTDQGELVASSPDIEEAGLGSKVYFWADTPTSGNVETSADWAIWHPGSWTMGYISSVAAGDLNGDGETDIFAGASDISQGFLNYGPLEGGAHFEAWNSDSILNDVVASADIGDLNGDGYEDLVLGNPTDSTNGTWTGAVHIYEGGTSTHSLEMTYEQADFSVFGDSTSDRLGFIDVGDLDANGLADLVVSSAAGGGEAYLFYGPIKTNQSVTDATAHIDGIGNTHCFLYSNLADIDQDGSSDLMATCPESASGGLHILFGVAM